MEFTLHPPTEKVRAIDNVEEIIDRKRPAFPFPGCQTGYNEMMEAEGIPLVESTRTSARGSPLENNQNAANSSSYGYLAQTFARRTL